MLSVQVRNMIDLDDMRTVIVGINLPVSNPEPCHLYDPPPKGLNSTVEERNTKAHISKDKQQVDNLAKVYNEKHNLTHCDPISTKLKCG